MSKWTHECSVETTARPEAIWSIFQDVREWTRWNAGIEEIDVYGPFCVGTCFRMTPPGQDAVTSELIEVRENEVFVDRTCVGELTVIVAHRIEPIGAGQTRITYSAEAIGPECEHIGPAISADFPDVLAALVRLAESQAS